MGLADKFSPEENNDEENSNSQRGVRDEQKKSLLAHAYSTKSDDNYKDITDWNLTETQVRLAFSLTSPKYGTGSLNDELERLPGVSSDEEFWNEAIIAVAHQLASSEHFNIPEFGMEEYDVEPRGAQPAMEMFHISASDIAEYLANNEEVRAEFETLMSDEQEGEPEPAEADD